MKTVFSEKVKAVRVGLGLQQEEFAHRLDVSTQMVSAYENAKSMPSFKTLGRLAEEAKQPVAWFFVDESVHQLLPAGDLPRTTPEQALDILRDVISQQPAAEPSAEPDESQLEALRSENAALKAELKKLRTSRGYGKTKVHVPPREAPPASDQRETGS